MSSKTSNKRNHRGPKRQLSNDAPLGKIGIRSYKRFVKGGWYKTKATINDYIILAPNDTRIIRKAP